VLGFSFFFRQQRQKRLSLSVVGWGHQSLRKVLDILAVNKAFDGVHALSFSVRSMDDTAIFSDLGEGPLQ
jgi:hypothetical protein